MFGTLAQVPRASNSGAVDDRPSDLDSAKASIAGDRARAFSQRAARQEAADSAHQRFVAVATDFLKRMESAGYPGTTYLHKDGWRRRTPGWFLTYIVSEGTGKSAILLVDGRVGGSWATGQDEFIHISELRWPTSDSFVDELIRSMAHLLIDHGL